VIARGQDLESCVPSPVPPPGIFVGCLEFGALSVEAGVALVTALGETTGPARQEAREALMTAALVDEPAVHRAMKAALVRVGALTAGQSRGLPTLRRALAALRRAVGRDRAAIGVCRLELAEARRDGLLLVSQTLYCGDGAADAGLAPREPTASQGSWRRAPQSGCSTHVAMTSLSRMTITARIGVSASLTTQASV